MRVIEDKPEVWPYLLASIILHLLIVFFLPKVVAAPTFDEKPMEIFAVEPSSKPETSMPHRIADIAKPAVEQRPNTAKFLGMYDSAVSQELVGLNHMPGKSGAGTKSKQKAQTPKTKIEENVKAERNKLFAFNKDIFTDKSSSKKEQQMESADFAPGGMDDFFPNFKRGAHTYLNVQRYPGVEYFVRLKHAFGITFNPEPSIRDYMSRNKLTGGPIEVVIGISISRSGELSELFVLKSSGIPAYDQESLRTVRASSPFATPPEKFLSNDGLLRIACTFGVY